MNFMSATEPEMKAFLREYLAPDFIVRPDVRGRHIGYQTAIVEADFIVRPRSHLIEQGFEDIHFVIEVKAPGDYDREKKFRETISQTASYLYSQFEGVDGFPAFGLIFPPSGWSREGDTERIKSMIEGVGRLSQYLGIGRFHILDKDGVRNWQISGGGGNYFSLIKGKGVHNVFRRPIGNVHTRR